VDRDCRDAIVAPMRPRHSVVAGVVPRNRVIGFLEATVGGFLGCLVGVAGPACHVVVQSDTTRPVATEQIQHPEGAVARRPTLVVTDTGRLRFIEPLECPTEEIIRQRTTTELVTGPNLATFTVGVVAAAIGGVMLASGLFSTSPGQSPYTYVGLAGAGVGLPFAIGPWIGNRTEVREPASDAVVAALRRPGPSQPCGERPLAAGLATLEVGGIEVHGAIGADGVFSISPYAWIDAYDASSSAPAELTATLAGAGGPRTIATVLDANALARRAAGFLAHADFDAAVEALKLVPAVAAGPLRASLTTADGGAAVRIVLPLRNDGPGDAWGLRGQITAPATPAIDGRMIYVGKLAKGATLSRELVIPVSAAAAAALRGATVELSVELRDAHGTAPATAVRFRGALAIDPPR
jgi:hypothetical protein